MSVDPLAIQYVGESPYSFAGNSPLLFVDQDGRTKITYTTVIDKDGLRTTTKKIDEKAVVKINHGKQRSINGYSNQQIVRYDIVVNVTVDYSKSKDGKPKITATSKLFEQDVQTNLDGVEKAVNKAYAKMQGNTYGEMQGEEGLKTYSKGINNVGIALSTTPLAPAGALLMAGSDAIDSGLDFKNKDFATASFNLGVRVASTVLGEKLGGVLKGAGRDLKLGTEVGLEKAEDVLTDDKTEKKTQEPSRPSF